MNKLINKRSLALLSAIVFILLSGSATISMAADRPIAEYFGRVIDTSTKEPLEGVVILAIYVSQGYESDLNDLSGAFSDTAYYSSLEPVASQETVTDINGEFKIYKLQKIEAGAAFVIFKPGYGNYPMIHVVRPNTVTVNGNDQIYNPGYILRLKYTTIELPMLTSRQARNLNIPAINFNIPYEKQINYLTAISKELQCLDLPIYYSRPYFKKDY